MKRTAPLLVALAIAAFALPLPVAAQDGRPCEGVEPGEPCVVHVDCDEPEPGVEQQETTCRSADGTESRCWAYLQDHGGYLYACEDSSAMAAASSPSPPLPIMAAIGGLGVASLGVVMLAERSLAGFRVPRGAQLVPVLPLFSRVKQSDTLDHPRRREIAQYIEANPGVRLADVGHALAVPNGDLRHHVKILQQNGVVVVTRRFGRVTLRAAGTAPTQPIDPPAAELLALLQTSGVHNIESARAALGWSRAKARYWVKRLLDLGLIEVRAEGREHRMSANVAPEHNR